MLTKNLYLFIIALLFCARVFAQSQTFYYNAHGKQVAGPDSAAYKRVLTLSDTVAQTTMFNFTDYYNDGKIRLTGKTSQLKGNVLEGRCVRYYPSGNMEQIANYTLGMMNGTTYDYYPNGKLYRVVKYEVQRPTPNSFVEKMPLIITCNDSTGAPLATNGNGEYMGYGADFKTIAEQGYIKNGLKVGQWQGQINNEKQHLKFGFNESYEDGKLNSGKSTDDDGTEHYYTARNVIPIFTGGERAFSQFLRDNIRYPKRDRENNIQGKVFVSFVVEKDGKLTGFKVLRSPGESFSAESLRVLNMSPNWSPSLWYGHPVRLEFTVPINFSLRGQ
ncbi:TonB family protein [Mucilaginibacter gracilis]|uniref:TonB family protein n=1 Tax=Mucilaginibacter gracilis TaxID=423350 RepID=A0A495J0I7_9SPHI|nr:energy transducer TonB [Mucilaginibacter gracilis]RKR81609.1 TonB family protein [Mucilaginibacter gracilis]